MNNTIIELIQKLYKKKYIKLWKDNIQISRPTLIIPSNFDMGNDIPNIFRLSTSELISDSSDSNTVVSETNEDNKKNKLSNRWWSRLRSIKWI